MSVQLCMPYWHTSTGMCGPGCGGWEAVKLFLISMLSSKVLKLQTTFYVGNLRPVGPGVYESENCQHISFNYFVKSFQISMLLSKVS